MTTLYDEHGNIIEPTGEASPVGFCPYCDYQLVAVGVCPECGKRVTKKNVQTDLQTTRRRRLLRRIFIALIPVALFFGGLKVYQSGIWKRWVPTAWLLSYEGPEDWPRHEALRRVKAEEVSDAEFKEIIKTYFNVRLAIRSPRPLDIPFRISVNEKVRWSQDSPLNTWSFSIFIDEVAIDDEVVARPSQRRGISFHTRFNSNKICELSHSLGPGEFDVSVSGRYAFELPGIPARYQPLLPGDDALNNSRKFSISQKVVVQDRTLLDLLRPVYPDEQKTPIIQRLKLGVSVQQEEQSAIHICCKDLPVSMVGDLSLFDPVSEFGLLRCTIQLNPGTNNYYHGLGAMNTTFGEYPKTAIGIFTPDPVAAFEAVHSSYFAGVLKWQQVPISLRDRDTDSGLYAACRSCRAPGVKPPDSIEPWLPDDEDGAQRESEGGLDDE